MLILSRKIGETIHVGDNVTIVINRISGNRVTVGIEAPNQVRILRGEVLDPEEAQEAEEPGCLSTHKMLSETLPISAVAR
ncbi:carbon storage regulator [Blastopirellula marina]|uniref:Translational regulator CsrA n=1 Tax=Blastopirellula marina DSM 3645 TaxID=314230 RepID=A3ZQB9_9BACT|nr:carbon storage regulator [Blastopirellula marina]EAQ81395.1 probable CsrA_thema carbon storage regulator-like protein [Blastopirellula marina DSM 3645]